MFDLVVHHIADKAYLLLDQLYLFNHCLVIRLKSFLSDLTGQPITGSDPPSFVILLQNFNFTLFLVNSLVLGQFLDEHGVIPKLDNDYLEVEVNFVCNGSV